MEAEADAAASQQAPLPPVRLLADAAAQTVKVGPPSPPAMGGLSTPSQPLLLPMQSVSCGRGVEAAADSEASSAELGGAAPTPGAARLRPHEATESSASAIQGRLSAAQEQLVDLRAANSILLQQVRDAKRSAAAQREEQEELFAVQLRTKEEEAAAYQATMDVQLLSLQQQMQLGMTASVAKVNQLKQELQTAQAELAQVQQQRKEGEHDV